MNRASGEAADLLMALVLGAQAGPRPTWEDLSWWCGSTGAGLRGPFLDCMANGFVRVDGDFRSVGDGRSVFGYEVTPSGRDVAWRERLGELVGRTLLDNTEEARRSAMAANEKTNDEVELTIRLPREYVERLRVLARGFVVNSSGRVEDVIVELVDHAQQGVYRPGAWERDWLCQAFSDDWLEHLEPDVDDGAGGRLFQRPRRDS